jgi:hypothetical protein
MKRHWTVWLLAVLAWLSAAAAGQTNPIAVRNSQIVAKTDAAAGVMLVEDDGGIRHLQSGLLCPADFPNVHFAQAQIYATDGTDVGCDYARTGDGGSAVSKLTIFATKAPAGATLASVFERYNAEVMSHPGTRTEPAQDFTINDNAGKPRTDYRKAGYDIVLGDRHFHSELIVGLVDGWMLEVRATYPSRIVMIEKGTTKEQMRDRLFDLESPYLAFIAAQESLEKAASKP